MGLRIKKCSSFLIESEFRRINTRIRLLTENLDEGSQNPKEEIIKNVAKSIENTTEQTEQEKKEVLDEIRVNRLRAKSKKEWDDWEQQESNFMEDIDLEAGKKTADIIWEIVPKETDTTEVSAQKIKTTYSIFDHLTKNAKKFFLTTCIGLLGLNVASNLFSGNEEADNIINNDQDVKKSGINLEKKLKVESPLTVFRFGEIGAGGSIGEKPEAQKKKELQKEIEAQTTNLDVISPEMNKKLKIAAERLLLKHKTNKKRNQKNNVRLINPKTLKSAPSLNELGDKFDASNTIFTSAEFPFEVNNKYNIDENLELDRSQDLKKGYLPKLDEVGKDKKTGLKMLAFAMTYMEGYRKGTISYTTENPGNIDNTDSGNRKDFGDLKLGIEAQLKNLEDIASDKKPGYKLNSIISRTPYKSPDPNLKKWIPGMIFVYQGTLEQFLRIYATGCRNDNNYLNIVLSLFEEYFPGKVTKDTTIKDIIELGEKGNISEMILKNELATQKAAREAAKKISDATKKKKK